MWRELAAEADRPKLVGHSIGTFWSRMFVDLHIYFGVAFAGLVSFLSPCVLPLVPPYLGYLGGTTISQASDADAIDNTVWFRVILGSLFFVLGFTTVFVGLGAGASVFGQLMLTYKQELSIAAGVVIILFGVHFLGILRIPLLYKEARYHADMQGASLVGAYVIGLAFAFGWTPCIGPVLMTVLAVAADQASLAKGVQLLLAYSLGLGVPFVLAAVAIRPFLSFMRRFKRHLGTMEKVMGIILILTGVMFISGTMGWLAQWMLETFPELSQIESWLVPEGIQEEILNPR